jgi:hypothetical protein
MPHTDFNTEFNTGVNTNYEATDGLPFYSLKINSEKVNASVATTTAQEYIPKEIVNGTVVGMSAANSNTNTHADTIANATDVKANSNKNSTLPASVEVWSKVWSKELQILADMGFTDTPALIPLLQEHVGLPVSLCAELNGVPPAEGMQKLVAALLSQSGRF